MTYQIFSLVLDKVLSWPVMAFGTILLFRKPLIDFLYRLSALKVGKDLVSISAPPQGHQSEKQLGTGLDTKTSLVEQAKQNESPLLLRQEELIRRDLQKLQLDSQPQEAVNILVRYLATAQLYLRAEQVYRNIFGSQIALLKQLNIAGSLNKDQLEYFYTAAKADFPMLYNNYSFNQYLDYLLAWNLISTEDNEKYVITEEGKAFLQWIIRVGAPELKPF